MGAHHFKFHLVPIGRARAKGDDGEPEEDLLVGHEITEATLTAFRSLLPRVDRWGPCEELCSGNGWGSDIRIWRREDGAIRDIGVRFSPVTESLDFLRAVLDLIRDAGCAITIDFTTDVYPADFATVLAVFRAHRSFRFLTDPEGAIKEAAKECGPNG